MTKRRLPLVALILIACFGIGAGIQVLKPASAVAAEIKNQQVGKLLQEAQSLAKSRNFKGALAKAKEAKAVSGKSKYEEFVVDDFLAYCYTNLRDYRHAADAYEDALNSGQAPSSSVAARVKTLAQLYFQVRNYSKSVSYANRYIRQYGADESLQLLIAQAYYQQGQYSQAVSAAKALANKSRPKKSVLQLLLSAAYKVHDSATVESTLFRLVALYPSSSYWSTLITTISNKGGLGDQLTLDLGHLKLALGLLKTGDDYFDLAKLALAIGLPGDAQNILDKGFKKKLLGSAAGGRDQRLLKLAKDDAAKQKAKLDADDSAASATPAGEDDIDVGLNYASFGQTDKAIAAIKRGMDQTLKQPEAAAVTLGRVYFEAGQVSNARRSFRSVKGSGAARDLARMWLIASGQI